MKRLALFMEIPGRRHLSNEKRIKMISQMKNFLKVIGGGHLPALPAKRCQTLRRAKSVFPNRAVKLKYENLVSESTVLREHMTPCFHRAAH